MLKKRNQMKRAWRLSLLTAALLFVGSAAMAQNDVTGVITDETGEPLIGVTVVEAGTQHNVIPDHLHFVIDVRTNEYYQNEFLFEFLRKKMQKCRLEARSFRLHSSCIPEDHPLIQRCITMGMKPFGSPTLSDQALMPFPSFKLGPGDSSRSHSADEFIRISEIEHAINTYVQLLENY